MLLAESMELPPAESDDEVAAVGAGDFGPFVHMGQNGVGEDLVEDDVPHALGVEHGEQPVEIAVGAHGLARRDDHEGLGSGQLFPAQRIEAAGAEQNSGGNGIGEVHGCSSGSGLMRRRAGKAALSGRQAAPVCRAAGWKGAAADSRGTNRVADKWATPGRPVSGACRMPLLRAFLPRRQGFPRQGTLNAWGPNAWTPWREKRGRGFPQHAGLPGRRGSAQEEQGGPAAGGPENREWSRARGSGVRGCPWPRAGRWAGVR